MWPNEIIYGGPGECQGTIISTVNEQATGCVAGTGNYAYRDSYSSWSLLTSGVVTSNPTPSPTMISTSSASSHLIMSSFFVLISIIVGFLQI
jgi:hypothetical protein